MSSAELVLHPLIIPSVVIPFTALLAGLSALASFLAALFGVRLRAEGPKKLLELLLKPKVLATALLTNFILIGGLAAYRHWKNAPLMLWRIEQRQAKIARASQLSYEGREQAGFDRVGVVSAHPERPGAPAFELLWERKLPAGSFRGAVPAGPSVFLGTDAGQVEEVDPASGEIRRSFFTGTPVSAAPLVFKGSLYVGEGVHDTHHARLYRFDLSSGRLAAHFTSRGHIEGEPVAASHQGRDLILVPTGAGGLVALDAQNLQSVWQASDGHTDAAALVVGDRVFSGTGIEKQGRGNGGVKASAYALGTGERLWSRELPASSWMQPVAWQDKVCFIYGEVYFPSELGGFACFRQSDGLPDISYNQAAPVVATPIRLGDDLFVSDLKGKLCRVSLLSGRARWCRETGAAKMALGNAVHDPVLRVLVYASQMQGLIVLDPENGKLLGQWQAGGAPVKSYAPAGLSGDGWILADMKGGLRKLRWRAENRSEEEAR